MAVIYCVCGKRHNLNEGKAKTCQCGVMLQIENLTAITRIPEDSLSERKQAGHKVILSRACAHRGLHVA